MRQDGNEEPNPLEKILEDMYAPEKLEPQRLNPRARWSKATAKAAFDAIRAYRSMYRRGLTQMKIEPDIELKRAERILMMILSSETEETIEHFTDRELRNRD